MSQRTRKSGIPHRARSQPPSSGMPRDHSRFNVSLPVRCTPVGGKTSRVLRGRTANISGGGFAIELPARLSPGTPVAVEIQTGIGPLRVEADIVWARRMPGKEGAAIHGLCLAGRSEVMDLPIHALLGQWLLGLAKQEAKEKAAKSARGTSRVRKRVQRRHRQVG